jgi:hypothetical protein
VTGSSAREAAHEGSIFRAPTVDSARSTLLRSMCIPPPLCPQNRTVANATTESGASSSALKAARIINHQARGDTHNL